MYNVHFTVRNANVDCKMYDVNCTLYSAHMCTRVECTNDYTVQYTVHKEYITH